MDEPQVGGMGADTGDHDASSAPATPLRSPADVALVVDPKSPDSPQMPVRHFKFTMASNGTILAATDQAVWFWGHKHELDVVGSKRINGGFDCDPKIDGMPNFKEEDSEFSNRVLRKVQSVDDRWDSSNIRTIEVMAEGLKGSRKFRAKIRRMKVEGSVFQDNMTLRNEKWVYNLVLHDMMTATTPSSTPKGLRPAVSHACIVEMEELTLEQDGTLDWHETARFRKGMEEDVELDAEGHETFNASHVGTIQVGALLNVIEWLSHGVALFDTEAKNLEELSAELKELIVNHDLMDGDKAQKVVQTMAMHHHHVTERKKENLERQAQ